MAPRQREVIDVVGSPEARSDFGPDMLLSFAVYWVYRWTVIGGQMSQIAVAVPVSVLRRADIELMSTEQRT